MVKCESELKSGLLMKINFYVKNPTVLSFSLVRILYTVQYHVCKEVFLCICLFMHKIFLDKDTSG